MRIYIAGHRGLAGSAIAREVDKSGKHEWFGRTRSELDLLDRSSVFDFMKQEKPDAVVIAAAKVGGIHANNTFPVEFLTENIQIQSNLLDASHAADVDRLLFLGSSCIYPRMAAQPIQESSLLTGPLEPTNEPYAIAKIAGIKLVDAYRKQYGHRWISAMPTNLYGPGDNFHPEYSHVVPALIRRFHEAKVNNASEVKCWGTGEPRREFMYSGDFASAALHLLGSYDEFGPINVGTGSDITIKELTILIAGLVGFTGSIVWDASKPDGTPRKVLDVGKLNSLGWTPSVTLADGLEKTYEWFKGNSEFAN